VIAPVFPGYIFVSFNSERDRWRSINGKLGVGRLIATQRQPVRVPRGVVEALITGLVSQGLTFSGGSCLARPCGSSQVRLQAVEGASAPRRQGPRPVVARNHRRPIVRCDRSEPYSGGLIRAARGQGLVGTVINRFGGKRFTRSAVACLSSVLVLDNRWRFWSGLASLVWACEPSMEASGNRGLGHCLARTARGC
jgi:hypothetical protein